MSTRVSVRQKLLGLLEDADSILKDILSVATRKTGFVNLLTLIDLLLEKDQQIKETYQEIEVYNKIQKKIDILKIDCAKSNKQIYECQLQLKKAESVLSTALCYSRQKLNSMTTAVKNPVDMEELVRFSHRISATHGAIAPDNWVQGDPRRPYPNQEEIRRGYLGYLDDSGNFRPSLWEALSETAAAAASMAFSSASTSTNNNINNSVSNCSGMTQISNFQNQGLQTGLQQNMNHTVTCSPPNMILPGVNMVSSPITVSQSSGPIALNGEMISPQNSTSKYPNSTLASTLPGTNTPDHHSRFNSHSNLPQSAMRSAMLSSGSQSAIRLSSNQARITGTGDRYAFPLSPGRHQTVYDPYQNSSQNPKSNQPPNKRGRRKHISADDIEILSSNSSSDSSSGEE